MTKHITILAIALAILIIGLMISSRIENQQNSDPSDNFFSFKQEQIASFEVNNFTVGLLFKKSPDGSWLIKRIANELAKKLQSESGSKVAASDPEFTQADGIEISKALTYLMQLKTLSPVTTKMNNPGVYEINDYSLHVILYDQEGHTLDKIYIGKQGPDPMTSFLKKAGADPVYMADQDFRALFFRNFEDWIAKKEPR